MALAGPGKIHYSNTNTFGVLVLLVWPFSRPQVKLTSPSRNTNMCSHILDSKPNVGLKVKQISKGTPSVTFFAFQYKF